MTSTGDWAIAPRTTVAEMKDTTPARVQVRVGKLLVQAPVSGLCSHRLLSISLARGSLGSRIARKAVQTNARMPQTLK